MMRSRTRDRTITKEIEKGRQSHSLKHYSHGWLSFLDIYSFAHVKIHKYAHKFVLGVIQENRAPPHNNRQGREALTGLDTSQICRQASLRRRELTVLCVCVAACVLAVCVAAVMVVDAARIRSLVLLDAEPMVRGRRAERETEDDRVLFTQKQNRKKAGGQTCLLALGPEKDEGRTTRQRFLFISNAPASLKASRDNKTMLKSTD